MFLRWVKNQGNREAEYPDFDGGYASAMEDVEEYLQVLIAKERRDGA